MSRVKSRGIALVVNLARSIARQRRQRWFDIDISSKRKRDAHHPAEHDAQNREGSDEHLESMPRDSDQLAADEHSRPLPAQTLGPEAR